MEPYRYIPGTVPLIVSIPHTGTYVPEAILERFMPAAKQLPDTDWHVEKLYGFAHDLGAHILVATHSRYVIDLNRGADNASLYPGKFTTGLCPATLFDGSPLYLEGLAPDEAETKNRTRLYWQPYHDKLQSVIDALKARHGKAVVFDAHSIASKVPTLFDGVLPDLNIGTADGKTAKQDLVDKLIAACKNSGYSFVCNGRFKGGFITRNYGKLELGIQAIQLELAQHNYMQETYPFSYDDKKASRLQTTLKQLLSILLG